MPQQATITINDGATTPIAHNFVPNGVIAQPSSTVVAEWLDKSPAYFVGYLKITEQYKPVNANGLEKFRFLIEVPSLEQVAGGSETGFTPRPTVGYLNTVVMEFWVHERSTAQELLHMYAYGKNLAASTFVKTTVENRERPW